MIINKSDKPASGLRRRLAFHFKRGRGHQLAYLRNRIRWHIYPRLRLAGKYPDHVDLELSSACNMACPMCYTTLPAFKAAVPKRNMPFELFRKIVDQLAARGVYSIRLSWRGEPTLNKRFIDCVRYAKQAGIHEVSSLTNALLLTREMFEQMVDAEMDWLTISFDGTDETYNQIRNPADYDEMVAKIKEFARIRREKRSHKPVLRLQGVWPAIAKDPETYFETFEPLVDEVSVNSLLDYLDRDDDIAYIDNFTCPVPFQRLVIGSDGRAFMCINDERGRVPVGDARVQTIGEIWNGDEMRRVRRIQTQHRGCAELAPCASCYQPRQTVSRARRIGDRVIELEDLVGRPQVIGR